MGLIGKNGAGKSTLLKLLSKEMAPDTGTIAMEKDIKIGFLKQDIDFVMGGRFWKNRTRHFQRSSPWSCNWMK